MEQRWSRGGAEVEQLLGGRRFKFIPDGVETFRIEIHRDSGLQRRFDSSAALFMKSLVIGKRSGDPCLNVWNREVVFTRGAVCEKRVLADLSELKRLVHVDMQLPRYPVDTAVEILEKRGVPVFE